MNSVAQSMYAKMAANAHTQMQLGIGVIVRGNGNRILLEKRSDSSRWGLPGGRIEPGESCTNAAIREVREETGLTVNDSLEYGL